MSSSSQGMGQISETTTSYETAITGGAATDSNVEKGTAKVTLGTDAGKPVFIKTIEGCSVERKYAMSKLYLDMCHMFRTNTECIIPKVICIKAVRKKDIVYFTF